MRHFSRLSLSQSIPVLPFSVENLALVGALVDVTSSLEALLPSDDCTARPRAVPPPSVAPAAYDLRGVAQLAGEQAT